MRKLIIILSVMVVLALPVIAYSGEVEVEVSGRYIGSATDSLTGSLGLKGVISWYPSEQVPVSLRLWGSYDFDHVLSVEGQNGYGEKQYTYNPIGFGGGLGMGIVKGRGYEVWLTIDLGMYIPATENDWSHGDGSALRWKKLLAGWQYPFGTEMIDAYTMNVAECFGGEIGIKGQYHFKVMGLNCNLGGGLGWVFRTPDTVSEARVNKKKLREMFPSYTGPVGNMQHFKTKDLGGFTAEIGGAIIF